MTQEPAQADAEHVARLHGLQQGNGLKALVLEIELQMVLKIPAHAGERMRHLDAELPQGIRIADAGELKELGRVDRTGSEDHLAPGDRPLRSTVLDIIDADSTAVLQ